MPDITIYHELTKQARVYLNNRRRCLCHSATVHQDESYCRQRNISTPFPNPYLASQIQPQTLNAPSTHPLKQRHPDHYRLQGPPKASEPLRFHLQPASSNYPQDLPHRARLSRPHHGLPIHIHNPSHPPRISALRPSVSKEQHDGSRNTRSTTTPHTSGRAETACSEGAKAGGEADWLIPNSRLMGSVASALHVTANREAELNCHISLRYRNNPIQSHYLQISNFQLQTRRQRQFLLLDRLTISYPPSPPSSHPTPDSLPSSQTIHSPPSAPINIPPRNRMAPPRPWSLPIFPDVMVELENRQRRADREDDDGCRCQRT